MSTLRFRSAALTATWRSSSPPHHVKARRNLPSPSSASSRRSFGPTPSGPRAGSTTARTPIVEPASGGQGADLVRVDAATGRRSVLDPGERSSCPRARASRSTSRTTTGPPTTQKLLIFTNSARVWRANTRGDFWVLDVATGQAAQARRAGGEAVDAAVRQVLARRQARRLRARAQHLRRVARRRHDHAAHDATARRRSSTARSTGCTRKS